MSFIEKVTALRTLFGISPSTSLVDALAFMAKSMGVPDIGTDTLPIRVDRLVAATGIQRPDLLMRNGERSHRLVSPTYREVTSDESFSGTTVRVHLHTPLQDGYHNLQYLVPKWAYRSCRSVPGTKRALSEAPDDDEPPVDDRERDIAAQCKDCRDPELLCECNATHQVHYTKSQPELADVFVYDTSGIRRPRVPPSRRNRTNLLLVLEPPAHLNYLSVRGFSGLISYHRDSLLWRPFQPVGDIQVCSP